MISTTSFTAYPVAGLDLASYGFQMTNKGLLVIGTPTYIQWEECGLMLKTWLAQLIERATQIQFAIGDWIAYGEMHYGEQYAQALSETDYDYGTLRNFKYVASNVPLSLRNDNLSFDHHRAVAPLEPDEQAEWLAKAEQGHLTAKQLREQVGAEHGRMPKVQTVVCPHCGAIFEL